MRIAGWDEHFENNRTRELKVMRWVPLPNKFDGDGYTELVDHKNGAAHFGAWVALVQVASRCDPRGTLLRSCGKLHDPASLARITRIPKSTWEEALPRLVTLGWVTPSDISQEGAIISHPTDYGKEGNGMEGKEENPPPTPPKGEAMKTLIEGWNQHRGQCAEVRVAKGTRKKRMEALAAECARHKVGWDEAVQAYVAFRAEVGGTWWGIDTFVKVSARSQRVEDAIAWRNGEAGGKPRSLMEQAREVELRILREQGGPA